MSVFANLSKIAHRGLFAVRKISPELLTGVGVLGVITSGVLLVRAGMNTEPILDDHKERVNKAKALSDTDEEEKKAITRAYFKTAGNISKLYAAPVLVGVAGVGAIVGGHGVLRKRNIAHIAAYKAIESTLSEYRKGVAAELGEEKESDIYKGVRTTDVVDANGKIKKGKTVIDPSPDMYDVVFDASNKNFMGDPDINIFFLRQQLNHLNNILHHKGHVTLNEVYRRLGFPETQAGMVVGWTSTGEGDRYINFGYTEDDWSYVASDAIRTGNGAIRLSFNVDGSIFNQI